MGSCRGSQARVTVSSESASREYPEAALMLASASFYLGLDRYDCSNQLLPWYFENFVVVGSLFMISSDSRT